MTDTAFVRESLLHADPHFRKLNEKHREYESRLEELRTRRFPTDGELHEEARLKKLKLRVKDEMEALVRRHAEGREGGE